MRREAQENCKDVGSSCEDPCICLSMLLMHQQHSCKTDLIKFFEVMRGTRMAAPNKLLPVM